MSQVQEIPLEHIRPAPWDLRFEVVEDTMMCGACKREHLYGSYGGG